MKKTIFWLSACCLIFSSTQQIKPFSFFGKGQKPEELIKEEEGDPYEKAKEITYKYFTLIYDFCKQVGSNNSAFISKIDGFKSKVDSLKKAKADLISEFGKMTVYLTLLYLEAKKVVKPLDEKQFNEKIKRTPDQTADELFELGVNPLEIKNAPRDVAPSLGINVEKWDQMVDEIKAESRA